MTNNSQDKPTPREFHRRHGRRGLFRRLKHWWSDSWLAGWRWRVGNSISNWWHPRSSSSYGGYGYGRSRSNRLTRAWRRLRHRIRESRPIGLLSALRWRLHVWWCPPTQDASSSHEHYGRANRNRLSLAWRRWRRRVADSAFGQWYAAVYNRLYEWWHPVWEDPHSYHGYYGQGRKSLPVVLWRKFRRRVRHSWLAQRWYDLLARFYDWWYPPLPAAEADYPHYQRRPVSRPVQAYRRWRRWFRQTWLGREFGWILDELAVPLHFLQSKVAQAFEARRLKQFFSNKRNLAAMAAVLLALVAGYLYGKPHYRRYVEQRYARQAEEFMLKRDFARAYLRARQVMEINPTNVVACRVTADLADWANSPFALYWRQRMVLLSPTPTNRLALAATALRAESFPYATAEKTLGEIEGDFRRTANYHMVAGALSIRLSRLNEAEQHYAEALKAQPDNPAARMSLAVVQLQSKDPKVVSDSRITLELLNTDGKLGLLPLRSLVAESANTRDFARAERLSNQVLTNAQAAFGDRMLHLAILRAAGRTSFQSYLKELQQKALEHPMFIGNLAAWLNQAGYASEALAWLKGLPAQVSGQGLIPLAWADAYAALGQWKELEQHLETGHWIGQDYIRVAMLALAIRNQPGNRSTDFAWDRAIRLTSDAPSALNMLAQLALSWRWFPEAERVLWHAATKFAKEPWPLKSLENLYAARRETANLQRVYQTSMQRDPKDRLARNNYTMVSLLRGKNLAMAHQYAAELHATEPGNPVFASTYALSLYLQGKTKEGLEVLRALKPEELANPSVAVYYGVLLSATGDAQAKDYLDKSVRAFLLPEELALVTSARKIN